MLFATVPTRGDHPEILARMVKQSGLPAERIVVLRTRAGVELPEGVVVVDDFGEINIHRWWNRGIAEAEARGATAVAVLNDDIVVAPETLEQLHRQLTLTGAALATPGEARRLFRGHWPSPRVLIGSLWVVDLAQALRPDESFRWWFGDDDLDVRARSRFGGIATVPVTFEHLHASESSSVSSALQALIGGDRVTFRRRHPLVAAQRRIAALRYGRTARFLRVSRVEDLAR